MACKITISLLSESQKGTIGNDWKYSLEAKVFGIRGNHAMIGEGTIEVPKHRLDSGQTQEPPGPPKPLVISGAKPGAEILVDMRIKATEVDVLQDDTAELTTSFRTTCPEVGAPAVVVEREVSVGVEEEPSGVGLAVFKLRYRVTIDHD